MPLLPLDGPVEAVPSEVAVNFTPVELAGALADVDGIEVADEGTAALVHRLDGASDDDRLFELEALRTGFARTENVVFPHWHRAGRLLAAFQEIDAVLGILEFNPASGVAGQEAAALLAARERARREGDFELADRLRQKLLAAGVPVRDRTPVGRGASC